MSQPPAPAGPRARALDDDLRRIVGVASLGILLALLDATIVNVGLHDISAALLHKPGTLQWVVTAYLLAMAAVLPATAWLARRWGPRRVFILAALTFTASSVGCGLASSPAALILWRAAAGAAGGVVVSVAGILATQASPPELRTRVMVLLNLPAVFGPIVGPIAGGVLIAAAGWRSIFFATAVLGALVVVLAARVLPPGERTAAGPLDVTGLILLSLGSTALTFSLSEIGTGGRALPARALTTLVLGLLSVAAFGAHAVRAPNPIIDIRLLANRVFRAAILLNFCIGATIFGAVILPPLYFQIVRGQDTVLTGALLLPQALGAAAAFWYSPRLVARLGAATTALGGAVIAAAGALPFAFVGAHTPYAWLLAVMAVRGFGIGMVGGPAFSVIFEAINPAKIADATVQVNVVQRIGGGAGTALFTVVLRHRLETAADSTDQAAAFAAAYWWVLATAVLTALPVLAWRSPRGGPRAPAPAPPATIPSPPPIPAEDRSQPRTALTPD